MDHFGWASVFLLFFQILGSSFLVLFLWNYIFWPCISHMYNYHPPGVLLAGYGWFEGKMSYCNTQIRVYHILFTNGTTDYFAAEDVDGIGLTLLQSFIWTCAFCSFIAHLCMKFQLIWSISHLEVFLAPCIQHGHCS